MAFKISSFIIGMLVVSLITAGLSLFIVEAVNKYNPGTDTGQSQYEAFYNKTAELSNLTQEIKDANSQTSSKTSITDILGAFFADGYRVLKTSLSSVTTFQSMSESAFSESTLGDIAPYVRVTVTSIIVIIIFMSIFVAALVKWEV